MKFKKRDVLLIALVIVLSIIGIVSIGSAKHIYNNNSLFSKLSGQEVWFLIGLVLMFICCFTDYEIICRFYIPIYILNLILLIAVMIVGKTTNSTQRWLSLGPIGIQPSEFSKIFMIIFLSSLVTLKHNKINKPSCLLYILLTALLPIILIMKQPSPSASIVILFITFIILFVGGLDYKYIYRTILISAPVGILLFWDLLREKHIIINKFLKPYQIDRVIAMIKSDPYSQNFYQTKQSMFAIGSGKLFGKGLYNGTINRLNYLPESHNDFIFSVIGEEFGFIGCVVVMCLLLSIIANCIAVAKSTYSILGKLISSGIAGMFAFQTFVNIGVATGVLPNTGMPLPFVSYGGSSLLVNMISIGIVLNISIFSNKRLF